MDNQDQALEDETLRQAEASLARRRELMPELVRPERARKKQGLAAIRNKLLGGLSIKEAAQRSGLPHVTTWRYVTGSREPTVGRFLRLCKGLGKPPDEVFRALAKIRRLRGRQ